MAAMTASQDGPTTRATAAAARNTDANFVISRSHGGRRMRARPRQGYARVGGDRQGSEVSG